MADVHLLGPLRRRLGAESLRIAAGDVRGVLDGLIERGGDALAGLVYADPDHDAPELHRDLRVLVNGRSILFLEGLATAVSAEDRVTVHLIGARGYPGG